MNSKADLQKRTDIIKSAFADFLISKGGFHIDTCEICVRIGFEPITERPQSINLNNNLSVQSEKWYPPFSKPIGVD